MSKRRIQVMLDDNIAAKIEQEAENNHIGASTLIRQIIHKYYSNIDRVNGEKSFSITLMGAGSPSLMEIAKQQINDDEV